MNHQQHNIDPFSPGFYDTMANPVSLGFYDTITNPVSLGFYDTRANPVSPGFYDIRANPFSFGDTSTANTVGPNVSFGSDTKDNDYLNAYLNIDNIDELLKFDLNGDQSQTREIGSLSQPQPLQAPLPPSAPSRRGPRSARRRANTDGAMKGVKRSRAGKEIATSSNHNGSVPADSASNKKGSRGRKGIKRKCKCKVCVAYGGPEINPSSIDFGNLGFSEDEKTVILKCVKLSAMVATDPKAVKRIVGNRLSAKRSNIGKAKRVADLERKAKKAVAEITDLKRDNMELVDKNEELVQKNKELEIRLDQAVKNAEIDDFLIDSLREEIERLKLAAGEPSPNALSMDANMFAQLDTNLFDQLEFSNEQIC